MAGLAYDEQAVVRSRPPQGDPERDAANKGREAAAACWETASILKGIGMP